jgi:hypothetical protein
MQSSSLNVCEPPFQRLSEYSPTQEPISSPFCAIAHTIISAIGTFLSNVKEYVVNLCHEIVHYLTAKEPKTPAVAETALPTSIKPLITTEPVEVEKDIELFIDSIIKALCLSDQLLITALCNTLKTISSLMPKDEFVTAASKALEECNHAGTLSCDLPNGGQGSYCWFSASTTSTFKSVALQLIFRGARHHFQIMDINLSRVMLGAGHSNNVRKIFESSDLDASALCSRGSSRQAHFIQLKWL